VSRFDAALIPENFEVDTETPVAIRCAHWPRCRWCTDFDGDDVVPLRVLIAAAQAHLDEAHAADQAEDVAAMRAMEERLERAVEQAEGSDR